MTQYVGLDVSMKETKLHVLDEAGKRVWRGRCASEPCCSDSPVVAKILEHDTYGYGFDAQSGEFGNLVSKGIIDPTKVVRIALQDGASIAGLLITTEAMVAEKPKKETPMPAMPPGGGMDY